MSEEFRKYFWDIQFKKLNIEKNKIYIISRLYYFGIH